VSAFSVGMRVTNRKLMLKKAKYVGTGKSKKRATMMRRGEEVPVPVKTHRCIRKNAIRTLFSAAAHSASQRLAFEAGEMDLQSKGGSSGSAAGLSILLLQTCDTRPCR